MDTKVKLSGDTKITVSEILGATGETIKSSQSLKDKIKTTSRDLNGQISEKDTKIQQCTNKKNAAQNKIAQCDATGG